MSSAWLEFRRQVDKNEWGLNRSYTAKTNMVSKDHKLFKFMIEIFTGWSKEANEGKLSFVWSCNENFP